MIQRQNMVWKARDVLAQNLNWLSIISLLYRAHFGANSTVKNEAYRLNAKPFEPMLTGTDLGRCCSKKKSGGCSIFEQKQQQSPEK